MAKDQTVNLNYDEVADVLYVSLDAPREAYCVEPEEGILLRADPDTGELVGVTIIGFQRRLDKSAEFLDRIPFVPKDLMPIVLRMWHETYGARREPAAAATR